MKVCFSAANITEAHIVAGMLQSRGVEAWVDGHYLQGGVGDLAAMDFAKVCVHDDELDVATDMVREYEDNAESDQPVAEQDIITT